MIFYTSDTHFGHKNIIKYCDRPWPDTDMMDQALVERWNSVVTPDDTVYHMGDVALSPSKIWPVSLLNGTIHLIAGNHDACWDGLRKVAANAQHRYMDAGFATVNTTGILENHELSDGRRVTLSHLPYDEGDTHHMREGVDKYAPFHPKDRGQVNVCGHVHDAWKVHKRSVNVGVDVWDWYPVAEETLIDTINRFIP